MPSYSKYSRVIKISVLILLVVIAVIGHVISRNKKTTPSGVTPIVATIMPTQNSAGVSVPSVLPSATATLRPETHSITLIAPTENADIGNGYMVSGSESDNSGPVYFRLKGGKSGQLASGQITVNREKFAITFKFPLNFENTVKSGDSGVLEVYNTDINGAEINIVHIGVSIHE